MAGINIVAGRRLERREKPPVEAQALRANHPNQSEFGEPEYRDELGREYRVAYVDRVSGWLPGSPVPAAPVAPASAPATELRLWVRLRRGRTRDDWWNSVDVPKHVTLKPLKAHLHPLTIDVTSAERDRPTRRTGSVAARVVASDRK